VLAPSAAYAFHEDAFFHSPGDVVEIRMYRSVARTRNRGGGVVRLERIVRRAPLTDLAVTGEVKRRYFEMERARYQRMARGNPRLVDMAGVERRLAQTEFPPRIPAHADRMIADATGHLWLLEYRIGEAEPYRWSVFAGDGRWLGVIETPPRFTISEIGTDYVLGVWQDTLDVQRVRMYRLDRARRRW
jgi:hypothetical protein